MDSASVGELKKNSGNHARSEPKNGDGNDWLASKDAFYPLVFEWKITDFAGKLIRLIKSLDRPPIEGPKFRCQTEFDALSVSPRICLKRAKFAHNDLPIYFAFIDFKFFASENFGKTKKIPPRWAAIQFSLMNLGSGKIECGNAIAKSYLAPNVFYAFDANGLMPADFQPTTFIVLPTLRTLPEICDLRDLLERFKAPMLLQCQLLVWKVDPELHTKLWKSVRFDRRPQAQMVTLEEEEITDGCERKRKISVPKSLLISISPLFEMALAKRNSAAETLKIPSGDWESIELLIEFHRDFVEFTKKFPANDYKWPMKLLRMAIENKCESLVNWLLQGLSAAIPLFYDYLQMTDVFNESVAMNCRALIEACAVFVRLNEENLLSDAVCSVDDGDVLLELVTFAELYETERVDQEL